MRLVGKGQAPPAPGWDALLEEQLELLAGEGLVRTLRPVEREAGAVVVRDGRRLVNLSSNDYLGLSRHPELARAAAEATAEGAGSTASRLIVGDDPRYEALERSTAAFKGTGAALVVGSGYLANVGVLAALLGRDDAVFSDRLNHASVWDGIRLSGARLHRYRHGDVDQLEAMLASAGRGPGRRKLIVTESVFGMDGDVAPLREIVELKEHYGAALMLDEAHGGGVFGRHGEGLAHELGVADRVDLHMGTFSKAFGVYGAFVAGSESWIRYLTTSCRTFIYSTALPPPVVAAIAAALEVVRAAHDRRQALREKAERLRTGLVRRGFDIGASTTQIVPVVVGESDAAVALGRALEERGVLAVPIRPPTVPRGAARLRLSVTSEHSDADLERALDALEDAGRDLGIVARA
jgi:8-amino-7-oxononanoate synthase